MPNVPLNLFILCTPTFASFNLNATLSEAITKQPGTPLNNSKIAIGLLSQSRLSALTVTIAANLAPINTRRFSDSASELACTVRMCPDCQVLSIFL